MPSIGDGGISASTVCTCSRVVEVGRPVVWLKATTGDGTVVSAVDEVVSALDGEQESAADGMMVLAVDGKIVSAID